MKLRFFNPKKLFDWWSVPHFMFGMVTALAALAFSLSVPRVFLATLALAIVWELLEKRYRISEAPGNGAVDVILPLIAFAITLVLVDRADPNPDHHMALLIVATLLYIFVNFFAWRARIERDREFQG